MSKRNKNKKNLKKAERRKQLEQQKKKKEDMLFFGIVAIIIIAILAGYYYFAYGPGSEKPSPEPAEELTPAAGSNVIEISTSVMDDDKAHFYIYDSNGVEIHYFVLKSSDGVIRAAFDACDSCFAEKLGYYQEGDDMVCNNCELRFPSVKINEEKGGCNPAPLDRTIDGNDVVIKISDIENGRKYFK